MCFLCSFQYGNACLVYLEYCDLLIAVYLQASWVDYSILSSIIFVGLLIWFDFLTFPSQITHDINKFVQCSDHFSLMVIPLIHQFRDLLWVIFILYHENTRYFWFIYDVIYHSRNHIIILVSPHHHMLALSQYCRFSSNIYLSYCLHILDINIPYGFWVYSVRG